MSIEWSLTCLLLHTAAHAVASGRHTLLPTSDKAHTSSKMGWQTTAWTPNAEMKASLIDGVVPEHSHAWPFSSRLPSKY